MAKIMLVVPYSKYYVHFQADLLDTLAAEGHEVIAVAPDAPTSKERSNTGVTFMRTPMNNTGMNPVHDLFSLYKLISLLKKEQPDILCCYSLKPNLYGSLAAKISKVKKVYIFVTGLGYVFTVRTLRSTLLSPFIKRLYSFAVSHCTRVFFENPDDAALFHTLNKSTKDKAVLVNGTGVNIHTFQPRQSVQGNGVFLLIARMIKDKGIPEFVQAAKILKKKYPEAVFQLLGPFDRNPSAITKEALMEWVSDGTVEYLGETGDVRPYLGRATVFVLPSCYREGTPKAILEAMAMGLPVITTNSPGCRETVKPEASGILVPPGDVPALARAMERFIQDKRLASRMGRISRSIAVEKYDVVKVNRTIKEAMGILPAVDGMDALGEVRNR